MKKALIVLAILSLALGSLMAGFPDGSNIMIKMNKEMNVGTDTDNSPYFGIFTEDLTFPKAQELGYKGNYGVLITGVVSGSPAWEYRLQEDDIILSIDKNEISNSAIFDKVRKNYRVGDAVKLRIFRAGEEQTIDFVFGSRDSETSNTVSGEKPKKAKKSAGYGGGTYIPMWFNTDLTDVNHIITSMGFGKIREDGILMQGGAGKISVGKGFFIGGEIVSYEDSKKIQDPNNHDYNLWMRYENFMGGVTLDKRIPITKNLILSGGFLLGGASHTIEVLKSNSNYDWTNWDQTVMDNENNHSTASRKYLIVQPKAEIMYRLLPWFGLRAEGGYVYGYAPKGGWRVKGLDNESFEVLNSPDTEYQGFTVSVGPWFGF